MKGHFEDPVANRDVIHGNLRVHPPNASPPFPPRNKAGRISCGEGSYWGGTGLPLNHLNSLPLHGFGGVPYFCDTTFVKARGHCLDRQRPRLTASHVHSFSPPKQRITWKNAILQTKVVFQLPTTSVRRDVLTTLCLTEHHLISFFCETCSKCCQRNLQTP